MSTVTYPSAVVPGPPRLQIDVPPEWIQVWAPDTLIAVREDVSVADHFLANLVVRHYQRVAPFGADEVLAELGGYAADRQRGELGPLRRREVDGRELVGAEVTFTDPQVGPVVQLHWFAPSPRGEVVDVLQVTGSCAVSRRAQDEAVIDAVIDSMRINP